MKVCDVTNFFSPKSGGVKTYINYKRRFIEGAASDLKHLLIIPGEQNSIIANGCCTTYAIEGPLVPWDSNYRYIRNIARIQDVIAAERPDIIEIGSPYLMPWAVRRVARHFRIPLVGFFHSNFPETYVRRAIAKTNGAIANIATAAAWRYARMVYGWCDRVIATSRHAEESLHKAGIHHTRRIPFGVDNGLFDPRRNHRNVREKFNIPEHHTLLLYVGRLTAEKDLRSLFGAFDSLQRTHPDRYSLMVAGGGPESAFIEQMAGQSNAIHYVGYRSADDGLPEIYACADLFVTPSPNETFGLSPLEALSSGLPVVGVRDGAVGEILPAECGELAEPYNPRSLAEAIVRMSARLSPELRQHVREYCTENFSWNRTFEHVFQLYAELIEEKRR